MADCDFAAWLSNLSKDGDHHAIADPWCDRELWPDVVNELHTAPLVLCEAIPDGQGNA